MSARKTKAPVRPHPDAEFRGVTTHPSARKKLRPPRVRLTHLEIRRGDVLRLRIAVADDALAEAGDELGALIKKIAPSTQPPSAKPVVVATPVPCPKETPEPDFIVTRQHDGDDAAYHEDLREHLVELFSSLCDASLTDALDIARQERDRRAEGGN